MKKTKWVTKMASVALAVMMTTAAIPAFAAEIEPNASADVSNYSYLAGQQRSISRNELYAQAEKIEDGDERKAFLIEHGVADREYSEEAAASYSYVSGRVRGASCRTADDTEQAAAQSGYSYMTGQQRGASYHQ